MMAADRLFLRIDAPFAACRPFVAGWYRPTAGFVTPSAVYGLLLNAAGVESRLWEHQPEHDGRTPASLMRTGLPKFRLALGIPAGEEPPRVQSVFQQLHNYPQDNSKIDDAENPGKKIGKLDEGFRRCRGNKFNITPVRREVLCDVHVRVAVTCDADFATALRRGLNGEADQSRYGVPFLGDNAFLLDRFEEMPATPTRWYTTLDNEPGKPRADTTRLTTRIDRADLSRTQSALFAPVAPKEASVEPPEKAWCDVGPA